MKISELAYQIELNALWHPHMKNNNFYTGSILGQFWICILELRSEGELGYRVPMDKWEGTIDSLRDWYCKYEHIGYY